MRSQDRNAIFVENRAQHFLKRYSELVNSKQFPEKQLAILKHLSEQQQQDVISSVNDEGRTLLSLAAEVNDAKMVNYLVDVLDAQVCETMQIKFHNKNTTAITFAVSHNSFDVVVIFKSHLKNKRNLLKEAVAKIGKYPTDSDRYQRDKQTIELKKITSELGKIDVFEKMMANSKSAHFDDEDECVSDDENQLAAAVSRM